MIIKFINLLQSVTLMIYKFITINTLRIQRKKEKQKSIDTKFSSSNFEIIFFRGCWSYVGNVGDYINPKNIQKISLEEPGCISVSFFLMFDVVNATFNNISVISWQSVLGGPGENRRPVASH